MRFFPGLLSLVLLLPACPPTEAVVPHSNLLPAAGLSEPPPPGTVESPACATSCRAACQASDIPAKPACEAICVAALRRPGREVVRAKVCGPTYGAATRALAALVKRAITEEAEHNLEDLYDRSVRYFAANRRFPPTAPPVPERLCASPDGMLYPKEEWWDTLTWKALGFRIERPFYFQYSYLGEGEGAGARFLIRAEADLNCNGVTSRLEISGSVDNTGAVIGERRVRRIREGE